MILVGLAARFGLSGGAADGAGGMMYASLAYVVIAFGRPTASPARIGIAAFAFSAVIECFQLTSIPATLGDAFAPLRLLLGSTFVATDLLAYAVGAVLTAVADATIRAQGRDGHDGESPNSRRIRR